MKGLILKDYLMMRKSMAMYLIILVSYGVLGIMTGNAGMLMVFSIIMGGILPVNSIAYDERYHWDSFAPVLPAGRKNIILSKYIFGLLLIVMTFIINIPMFIICDIKQPDVFDGILDMLLFDTIIACICMIMQSFTLPVNVKYGTKKARLIMMILCIIPMAIIVSIGMISSVAGSQNAFGRMYIPAPLISILMLVIILVIYSISIKTSIKWYQEKDF